jgi:hypothetical protein
MAHVTLSTARSWSRRARWEAGLFAEIVMRLSERLPGLRSRARRAASALARLRRLCSGIEIVTREEATERRAELAAAHREALRWKAVAEGRDARIAELEADVATAQVVATDLRARLVCLHGKLATTAATARYQSYTTALEARAES